ncbi:MAG TPA: PilZ domain-containing protein [Blastocatellia bacterium]|nr:PilZ domain-containing protein [Blastocatellia bacterium]
MRNSASLITPEPGSMPLNTGKLISAYYLEIDYLLERVEGATTHYQTLGLERSAAADEVISAYQKSVAVLHPSYYKVRAAVPDDMLVRVDQAFKKLSQAFADLTDLNKRTQYDVALNSRLSTTRQRDAVEGHRSNPPAAPQKPQKPEKPEKKDRVQENAQGPAVAAEIRVSPELRAVFTRSSKQPATLERRRCERFKLSVPALVAGYESEGGKWQEVTKTINVSRMGVAVWLRRQVKHGLVVHITLPLPTKLRSHGFAEPGYNMYAIVRRVEPLIEGRRVVGLEFIGATPPTDFLHKPWSTFRTQKWAGPDRRREPRERRAEPVAVEYLDEEMKRISREAALTEDVSLSGARVRVKSPPAHFEFVRVTSPKLSFSGLALLRNQWIGEDGFKRLCLQFVDQKWPM